jgi:hypothetical protein
MAMAFEGEEFIKVDCHAGQRGEETPRRLHLGARVVQVVRVIDQWLAPDHRYFKVEGVDGSTYLLRHDALSGRWALVQYRRGR